MRRFRFSACGGKWETLDSLELEQYPVGAVVEARGSADIRTADKNIVTLAVDGLNRADHHPAVFKAQATPERDPREVVDGRSLGASAESIGVA